MSSTALHAALAGLGLGLSLIVAIGAQNAFVLRQGLRREHVGPIVAFCALSDAALILAGVAGMGAIIAGAPALTEAIRWGGAGFLIAYGALALRRAARPTQLRSETAPAMSARRALATIAALTWLNPHVYLDTLLLVGSIANSHGPDRWVFATGAAVGSILWFGALGYGARGLSPLFARPVAWRVLDVAIAGVMFAIALGLILGGPIGADG